MKPEPEVQETVKRRPKTGEQIAKRVADRLKDIPRPKRGSGVQPLNPGVFVLEAMRSRPGVKTKVKKRAPLRRGPGR